MNLRVKRSQENYFRARARDSECEEQAYLVGTLDSPDSATVHYFAYPEYHTHTPTEVASTTESWETIRAKAEAQNLMIIGMMHSHPNWWPVKSPTDHDTQVTEGYRVVGITAVMGRRTKVYYWIPETSLPCKVIYV